MLSLKNFLPVAGGKACFARRIFAVVKFFINLAPDKYCIYIYIYIKYIYIYTCIFTAEKLCSCQERKMYWDYCEKLVCDLNKNSGNFFDTLFGS